MHESAPATNVRSCVLALTLLLVAVAYLDRVCIAPAAPAIKQDLHIGDEQMGWVFSGFTLAYAIFEIPSGWMADRFGARRTLGRVVVWWSALTAATGLATGFASLFALRLLFGMGEAGAFPATARVYSRWLPAERRGAAFGLAILTGAIGGAITQPLVVYLLSIVSWRTAFACFGCVGLVWAAVWLFYFRDDPREHPGVNAAELRLLPGAPAARHERIPWAALATNRTMIALAVMYFGAIYGWYFYLTWAPSYLLRARGFDLKHAGWLSALPLLGIAAGVFLGGAASDALSKRFGSRVGRRLPGLVGFPLAALAIVAAVSAQSGLASAWLLAGAALLAALGVPPAWAVCLEIGGSRAGVVSGAMNTFGNLGGALSPVVVGTGVQRFASWNAPLYSVAAMYVVAAGAWWLVDPKRTIDHWPEFEGESEVRPMFDPGMRP